MGGSSHQLKIIYRCEEHSQVPGLAKQGKKNLMPRLFLPPSSWEAGQYSRLQQRSESKLQISFSMRSDSSFVCLKAPIACFEPQVTQQLFLLQQQQQLEVFIRLTLLMSRVQFVGHLVLLLNLINFDRYDEDEYTLSSSSYFHH